jgi:hypothetical protein
MPLVKLLSMILICTGSLMFASGLFTILYLNRLSRKQMQGLKQVKEDEDAVFVETIWEDRTDETEEKGLLRAI